MLIEVEEVSPIERKVSVEIPWDVVQGELDSAYKGLQRRAQVKGFRPGKVPRKVLEQVYRQTVESEVVGRLIDKGFRQAVDEHDLFPIAQPALETASNIQKDQPLSFTAKVEVKPEVQVETYKGLDVTRKIKEVTDEDVDNEIQSLREKATVIEQIEDRSDAQSGDLAVVDFFGTIDGEAFKGGKGVNYTVEIGTNQMIPGFEEQIIGMNIGDEKNFSLTFPDNYGSDEVKGKTADWRVELKELKQKILPELDDELAKDLGEFDTLDELKENVKENLSTRQKALAQRSVKEELVKILIEKNPVVPPDSMVERQIEFIIRSSLRMPEGQDKGQFQEILNSLRDTLKPQAVNQVSENLILEGIVRQEAISTTESEIEAKIGEMSREYNVPVPKLKQQLKDNNQLEMIEYNLLQDKALSIVMDNANVTDVFTTESEEQSEHHHEHDDESVQDHSDD